MMLNAAEARGGVPETEVGAGRLGRRPERNGKTRCMIAATRVYIVRR
jgi:hypothetical protein